MKRGNQVLCEGIDLGDGTVRGQVRKYLEVLGRNEICQGKKMKEKIPKEYYKRVRAVLKSKLNGGNVKNTINKWAVATAQYGA